VAPTLLAGDLTLPLVHSALVKSIYSGMGVLCKIDLHTCALASLGVFLVTVIILITT
jgi:hypothetical protein